MKKIKILIVNVYFPEMREPIKRRFESPDALAPVLLGGYFSKEHCEVKLYSEVNSGFIEVYDPDLLSWPDMIIMTGLTATFDRLLHLTAYAKSANPDVVTVAGGHAVRALPNYSQSFFDYTCTGDVDQMPEVIEAVFGKEYLAAQFEPRYDLAYWIKVIGYVESTRNCNFKCSFCSLTSAGLKYNPQSLEYLEAQLDSIGKRPFVFLNDNQLLGDSKEGFQQRLACIQRRREAGQFRYWGGFVTDTFFWDEENIRLAAETGCLALFVGVEAFDNKMWLKSVNKKQNSKMNQVELIESCLDAGILFQYGLVYDPTNQTLEQMYQQLDLICSHPEIPAPNFIFTAIPFPGTPFFQQQLEAGNILPNTHMRDLEGSTLSLKPVDPVDDVVHFITHGRNFRGYRWRFFKHQLKFLWRYRKALGRHHKLLSILTALAILAPGSFSSPGAIFKRKRLRTNVSTTERLDDVYTPRLPVRPEYLSYFQPTWITDHEGRLNPELEEDALADRYKRNSEQALSMKLA